MAQPTSSRSLVSLAAQLTGTIRRAVTRPAQSAVLAVVAVASLSSAPAWAEDNFPTRPVKMIVPFATGGSTDILARVVAEQMRKELGQPVVVDNRAGAGGMLGTEIIAGSGADGYTIGMATVSTMAVNPLFFPKAVAANEKLLPLTNLVSIPIIMTVNPSLPVKDFASFLDYLREQSKGAGTSTGVPGIGSLGHIFVAAFADKTGTKIEPVAYRGMGPAQADAIGGVIPFLFDQAPSIIGNIKGGKLRPIAVAAAARLAELPDTPTLKELGYSELNELGQSWFGLVIPAKTPAAVADRLREAARKTLASADTVTALGQLQGTVATSTSSADFQTLISRQLELNRAIVQRANIKVE